MLHRRDGARFPPDVTLGIQARVQSWLYQARELCLLANSKRSVMCLLLRSGYHKRPDWCSAAVMVVLLEGSRLYTEELFESDHWVFGHLPDQGPSLLIA